MLIRPVRHSDLPTCGEIYARAFSGPPYDGRWTANSACDMLAGLLDRDPESCRLIEMNGLIAGFAFCTSYGSFRATIQEFAVSPEFQGRGLGTELMTHMIKEFHERGLKSVDLIVNTSAPAYRLYQHFGFIRPDPYAVMLRRL